MHNTVVTEAPCTRSCLGPAPLFMIFGASGGVSKDWGEGGGNSVTIWPGGGQPKLQGKPEHVIGANPSIVDVL